MITIHENDLRQDLKIDPYLVDPKDPLGVFNLVSFIPKVIEDIMGANLPADSAAKFVFDDGTYIVEHYKQIVFNIIWWRILVALKIPLSKRDFWYFKELDENTLARIHTSIKTRCLVPGADRKKILSLMYESIPIFYNFIHRYCCEFVIGIDLIKLYTLKSQPDVKALCDLSHLVGASSKEVEDEIKIRGAALIDLFITKYPYSPLTKYLVTGTLNTNQVIQMFVGYGPRADINDQITGAPILHGTLSGLRSVAEFAAESLAAKKAAVYNKVSVRKSAYGNRQGQLTLCEIYTASKCVCDNPNVMEMYVDKHNKEWFIGKTIVECGVDIRLSDENINHYLNKSINMVSAMDCRLVGGICERCMGEMTDYFPEDMHLGLTCGAAVLSKIMQNILSAKHLVKTNTLEYIMTPEVDMYFKKFKTRFFFKKQGKAHQLLVPKSSINPFMNLIKIPASFREAGFSSVSALAFMDKNDNITDEIQIASDEIIPSFSTEFIAYLLREKSRIKIIDNLYAIPMDKWDSQQPILKIPLITFDMNAYVKAVQSFFSKDIVNFHDPGEALRAFCIVLYKKSKVNIFLAELLLKALMISSPTDYSFPIRNLNEPVYFGKLKDVIDNRAITPKLAFEKIVGKDIQFLHDPKSFIRPRPIGCFGPFMNL